MVCRCALNLIDHKEDIIYSDKVNHGSYLRLSKEFYDKKEINEYLYFSLCDFLNINFQEVTKKITNLYLDERISIEYLINFLTSNYGPFIAEIQISDKIYKILVNSDKKKSINFRDALEEQIYKCFSSFILLQSYYLESQQNKELRNPDIFEAYAQGVLNSHIYTCSKRVEPYEYSNFLKLGEENSKNAICHFMNALNSESQLITFETESSIEFLSNEFYYCLKGQYSINKCVNCNKLFVAYNRSDTLYCDRLSPQDSNKTCKEYVKYEKYLFKSRNDEAMRLYKQIYNNKANKVRRCVGQNFKTKLENFIAEANQWKNDVKAGSKTEHDYICWLKYIKERDSERHGKCN